MTFRGQGLCYNIACERIQRFASFRCKIGLCNQQKTDNQL